MYYMNKRKSTAWGSQWKIKETFLPNKETDITKKERTKDDRPRRAIAWMVSNKDEMSFNEEKEKSGEPEINDSNDRSC